MKGMKIIGKSSVVGIIICSIEFIHLTSGVTLIYFSMELDQKLKF
jgi:hypothetical protein